MSVLKSKRNQSKLKVLTNANELAAYTLKICSNEKSFSKRYRWCITNKIVETSLDISNHINIANSIYVTTPEDYRLRRKHQVEALASTYSLLTMIDIAFRTFDIDSKRIEHWTGLIIEVQDLIRSWKNSDTERYEEYKG